MNKDTVVMKINTDEAEYEVITPELLPYQLRGKLRKIPTKIPETKSELNQFIISSNKNYDAIMDFASSRVLPLTRKNAKKIYQLFGYEQRQDNISKAKIAFICKAVSLQDNYWFRNKNDSVVWNDVNLRHNHLNEIVTQVALHGSSLTLTGTPCTPELNGQGTYAKAWKRENEKLWLHKMGTNENDNESKLEVMVSNLLDKCNVEHIKYYDAESNGIYTCKCECMTTDNMSILPGMDFIKYCNVNGLDSDKEMKAIDKDNIYKMWIIDYLISNRDRHGMNWGFYYDANTMTIEKCHPLFDHNNAFDNELMKTPDVPYLFNQKMTMRQAAKYAMEHTDFYFTEPIRQSDFLKRSQYLSFMERAEELDIPTKAKDKSSKRNEINKSAINLKTN